MSAIDDGGPAFPCQPMAMDGGACGPMNNGISIRDYFASMAMESMLGLAVQDAQRNKYDPARVAPGVAKGAYAMADAMLAARKEDA